MQAAQIVELPLGSIDVRCDPFREDELRSGRTSRAAETVAWAGGSSQADMDVCRRGVSTLRAETVTIVDGLCVCG